MVTGMTHILIYLRKTGKKFRSEFGSGYRPSKMVYSQGCSNSLRSDENRRFVTYLCQFGSGYWPTKMVYSQGCSNSLRSDENRRFWAWFWFIKCLFNVLSNKDSRQCNCPEY